LAHRLVTTKALLGTIRPPPAGSPPIRKLAGNGAWQISPVQFRGKPAGPTSPGATSRVASASPRAPRRNGGTRRASSGFIPSTQASIAAGASRCCTAGAWGASEAGEDVDAAQGTVRALRRAAAPSPTTISTRRSRSPSHQCRQPTTGSARPRSPMQDDEPHRQMTALGELKVTGFLLICRFYH
jgi:hypothetical protein